MNTPNYLENFCQSIFNTLNLKKDNINKVVVGGDGRFYNKEAIQTIIKICIANNVDEIHIG